MRCDAHNWDGGVKGADLCCTNGAVWLLIVLLSQRRAAEARTIRRIFAAHISPIKSFYLARSRQRGGEPTAPLLMV